MVGYEALAGDAEGDGSGFVNNVLIARSLRRRWLPPSFFARDLANRKPHLHMTYHSKSAIDEQHRGQ